MKERKPQGSVASDKTEVVRRLPAACRDEQAAVEFFEEQRWGKDPSCPRCGVIGECYQMRDRKTGERTARYLWRCRACSKQYTVRVGTVMEDSPIPLRCWAFAFWAACSSKKGVSALQIKRQTGLSYKSALFLMHRIRFAMMDPTPRKLEGTIEADETYTGGRPRNPTGWHSVGRGTKRPIVFAALERGGEVRPVHITRVCAADLRAAIRQHVDLRRSRLMTDEEISYKGIGPEFHGGHHRVLHKIKQYAVGDVTTNSVEGFFALLKRGLHGTFHSVSRKHLHRYLDEFAFRWNYRKVDDGARTVAAIKAAEGKRFTYKEQIAKEG